jgi:mxaA protein
MKPCALRTGSPRGLRGLLLAALLAAAHAASSAAAPAAAAVPAIVQQPRAFGYVLGDVLTQRVLLQTDGHDLRDVTPPSIGRTGVWLERRPALFETDAAGRRWIVIGYQIVNAPQTLTKITLPALTLSSPSGAQLQVPEWPASVGPLTPPNTFAVGDLQLLRPDRAAPLATTIGLHRQIVWALGLLLATLLAWAAWWGWRNRRDSARLPFARAWRRMQRLQRAQAASSRDAWFCLHQALNEAAGQVVHSTSLSALFDRAPYLQPLRAQLEHFYQVSAEHFFKPAPSAAEFPLQTLCRALYRAERRQQR